MFSNKKINEMNESESILQYVEQIAETVKKKFKLNTVKSFIIGIDKLNENENEKIRSLRLNNFEYTCVIAVEKEADRIRKFLKTFTGKQIECKEDLDIAIGENKNFLLWGEGVCSENPIDLILAENNEQTEKHTIESIKFKTRLPRWLDTFLFDKLGAVYEPNHNRFDRNFDLSNEELLVYVGTYFPRSYAETFGIFSNLLSVSKINDSLSEEINILSFGSGSGGDIVGLLVALLKYKNEIEKINIVSIDAHKEALEVQKKIIGKFENHYKIKVDLKLINIEFKNKTEIEDVFNDVEEEFDFIVSAKCISELVATYPEEFNDGYYDIGNFLLNYIKSSGLLLILDVTIKVNEKKYLPIMINSQLRRIDREINDYKTLIPIPCALYAKNCYHDCFTQQQFLVSHKCKNYDLSKVTYRIIGNTDFVNETIKDVQTAKYIIRWDSTTYMQVPKDFCIYTGKEEVVLDGFKL